MSEFTIVKLEITDIQLCFHLNNDSNTVIHPSLYLLAKCQHNKNNNITDNAKWNTEQKRETLC